MATKGDKFTNRDMEELRRMVVGKRSGPRAQSDFQAAAAEIRTGPSARRKWRRKLKAWRKDQAEAGGQG